MKEAVEKLGGLDTLVNNAGILGSVGNTIETTSLEEWSRVLQTNLTSAFMLTQYACLTLLNIPHLLAQTRSTTSRENERQCSECEQPMRYQLAPKRAALLRQQSWTRSTHQVLSPRACQEGKTCPTPFPVGPICRPRECASTLSILQRL